MCKVLQTGYAVDTAKQRNNNRNVKKISNKKVRELKLSFNKSHPRVLRFHFGNLTFKGDIRFVGVTQMDIF